MISRRETTWIRRRKEAGTRKATRLPLLLGKKRTREEDATHVTMLDRDATMCQYLMAERFIKSILEYQHKMQEGVREISDVIMRRLTSLDEYADVTNSDRAAQQLRLLADVIACWIIEIYDEVAETHKEMSKQYDKKRQMKRLEVNDDNKTNNPGEQMGQLKEKEKQEGKNNETAKKNNPKKENPKKENPEKEQKGDESDKEKDKAKGMTRETEQLDVREAKNESVKEEKEQVENEQKNVESEEREKEEKSKEVHEMEEKKSEEKESEEKESEEKKEKEVTMEE